MKWVGNVPVSSRICSPLQSYPGLSARKNKYCGINVNYPTLTSVFQLDCTCVEPLFSTSVSGNTVFLHQILPLKHLVWSSAAAVTPGCYKRSKMSLAIPQQLNPRAYGERWKASVFQHSGEPQEYNCLGRSCVSVPFSSHQYFFYQLLVGVIEI